MCERSRPKDTPRPRWWPRKKPECDHDWRYYDEPDKTIRFTGYLERCSKCGEIAQIPQ